MYSPWDSKIWFEFNNHKSIQISKGPDLDLSYWSHPNVFLVSNNPILDLQDVYMWTNWYIENGLEITNSRSSELNLFIKTFINYRDINSMRLAKSLWLAIWSHKPIIFIDSSWFLANSCLQEYLDNYILNSNDVLWVFYNIDKGFPEISWNKLNEF